MSYRVLMMLALATTLSMSAAQAFDDSKYPNWKGAWIGGWTKRLPGVAGRTLTGGNGSNWIVRTLLAWYLFGQWKRASVGHE